MAAIDSKSDASLSCSEEARVTNCLKMSVAEVHLSHRTNNNAINFQAWVLSLPPPPPPPLLQPPPPLLLLVSSWVEVLWVTEKQSTAITHACQTNLLLELWIEYCISASRGVEKCFMSTFSVLVLHAPAANEYTNHSNLLTKICKETNLISAFHSHFCCVQTWRQTTTTSVFLMSLATGYWQNRTPLVLSYRHLPKHLDELNGLIRVELQLQCIFFIGQSPTIHWLHGWPRCDFLLCNCVMLVGKCLPCLHGVHGGVHMVAISVCFLLDCCKKMGGKIAEVHYPVW